MNDRDLVQSRQARLVLNARRAQKLRKRGEYVWWSVEFQGWLWTHNRIHAGEKR